MVRVQIVFPRRGPLDRLLESVRLSGAIARLLVLEALHESSRTSAKADPVEAPGQDRAETERMRRHYSTVRDREAVEAGERVAFLAEANLRGVSPRSQPRSRAQNPVDGPQRLS
jgi:hypothetical protein